MEARFLKFLMYVLAVKHQALQSVTEATVTMDVDLNVASYKPSLKGASQPQDGSTLFEKVEIVLKPNFAAEQPPCRIYVEIVSWQAPFVFL